MPSVEHYLQCLRCHFENIFESSLVLCQQLLHLSLQVSSRSSSFADVDSISGKIIFSRIVSDLVAAVEEVESFAAADFEIWENSGDPFSFRNCKYLRKLELRTNVIPSQCRCI